MVSYSSCEDYRMNVTAELEIATPLPQPGRRTERASLNLAGGLRKSASTTLGATILDLSTHGFRAEVTAPLSEGTVVWLKLPGLAAQQGRVVWSDRLTVGCALTAPLHPAVFDHIVKTYGHG
jgi:PilZ domain